jgi:nucleotide-binding universal stress UspA family protein
MPARPIVLCPVDFSEHSRAALRLAWALAARQHWRVRIVAVNDSLLVQAAAAYAGDADPLSRETGEDLRVFIAETFQGIGTIPEIDIDVRCGKAAPEILAAAQDSSAQLIVMSTQGLSGFRKAFFGATTERVLRETTVPVLVVPAHETGAAPLDEAVAHIRRIVVPVDFTDATAAQVATAAAVAAELHASLVVAHVIEPFAIPASWRTRLRSVDSERRARADEALDEVTRSLDESVRAETVRLYGDPAEEIAKLARDRDAGLVVMGLHSSRLLGPRMGSVTYRVLCLVSIPVLALPPHRTARKKGVEDGTPAPPSTP